MDKALACHTGGRGMNRDTTKDFSAPILSGTPAMCTLSLSLSLSLTMPVIMCYSMNTCHWGSKKRGIMAKERCMGERGQKKFCKKLITRRASQFLGCLCAHPS